MPAPGHVLLVADYNQIELRCIAHLAEDPGLIEAFRAGGDIHNATAARVFGVEPDDGDDRPAVEGEDGVATAWPTAWSPTASAQRLNIPTEEAAEILDAYFVAFPNVKAYMDRTVIEARKRGYTETLFGRRRPIPELSIVELPHPPGRRAPGDERRHPGPGRRHLQGRAGPPRRGARRARRLASRLILQVHDEVLVEVRPDEKDAVARADARDACAARPTCACPLEVNLAFGPTWADAKG